MPIEFTCTHCNKQLKLPDVTAGLRGECPHCEGEFVTPQPNVPSFEELGDTILRKEYPEGFQEALQAHTETNSPFPLNDESVLADSQTRNSRRSLLSKPVTPTPIANELRRKQQHINPATIWVPALLMVAVIVIAVWWVLNKVPTLKGELVARKYHKSQVPTKTLQFSELVSFCRISEDELKQCLTHLHENPIPVMRGEDGLMNVRLDGTPAELTATVIPPHGMKIVRVSLLDETLKNYLEHHQEELDRYRTDELHLAVEEFFKDYKQAMENGTPIKNLSRYRYQLCLNSLVGGIGYHTVAVIDQRAFLCVYEDNDHSGIYFIVPENTKSFQLHGRKINSGKAVFDCKYDVKIADD